jgi:NAD(P)H dehydrogenase (quinone)
MVSSGSRSVTPAWIDSEDISAVAALCLADPDSHKGKTYRLGAEIRSYHEIAGIMSDVIGHHFVYEPQSPSEFLAKSVAAGAEPVYMRSVHDNYADLEAGRGPGVSQPFEDFSRLTGKAPSSLSDFIASHVDCFRY